MKNVTPAVETIPATTKTVPTGHGKTGKETEKAVAVCGYETASTTDADN